jgi:hypothetical protein
MISWRRRYQRLIAVACLSLGGWHQASAQEEIEAALERLPRAEPDVADILRGLEASADDQARTDELQRQLRERRQRFARQLPVGERENLVRRNDVLEYTAKLRAYETEIGRVRGSVTFGTTGDTTSSQDQFKATAGIDFSVGTYPSQLRVLTKADVRNTNNELSEDVSTFLVNFDHYFVKSEQGAIAPCFVPATVADTPAERRQQRTDRGAQAPVRRLLESYGFIERFSDSFMGINRRFEVGGGVKLEWHSGSLTDKGCAALRTLEGLRAEYAGVETAFNELAEITNPADPQSFSSLFPRSTFYNRAAFARNQYSKWETGVAFSLFRESERPSEFVTTVLDAANQPLLDDDENVITKKLAPPTTNGERFTVRPSLIWRPRDDFKLTTVYYYKMKLGADSRVNGVRDVRRDVSLAAEWTVGELTKTRGQPTIVLALEEHEDSVPPDLSTLIPAELPAGGAGFTPLAAEREHRQVRLEVKVSF